MRGFSPTEPRTILGINSGTSADAVDLALVRIQGAGQQRQVESIATASARFPEALQKAIHAAHAWSLADVARFDLALGVFFGRCGKGFLQSLHIPIQKLTCAASHGQTVYHHQGDPLDGSLQLGDPSALAQTLGADVVANFRAADLAAGGQGAPISPFADWVLHGSPDSERVILNLGGIANLTLLPPRGQPLAWDSGPANAPLDALMRLEKQKDFDQDGRLTLAGKPLPALLQHLQEDAYFTLPIPKSTGLEHFGLPLARHLRSLAPDAQLEDLLATLAELGAWSVAQSLRQAGWQGGAVYVAGGGVHNLGLKAALVRHLGASRLHSYDELGWDGDSREAVAFALLGDAFLHGETSTWPTTTGCQTPSVLGQWVPGPQA